MRIPPRFAALAAAAAVAATLFTGQAATAAPASAPAAVASVGSVCYSALPDEAYDTLELIDQGGPFPYSQDGIVFQNREHVLPTQTTGYYHEYTVITPGSPTRGARRIVTGEQYREDYYTADHYVTFRRVNFGC
ncbi:ribonuclease T1 [Streptomyces sp. 3211.6]|uniref:ribonuclease domain-containing protein n=1 Tax=unclassified Streptomyces TaxID=2593676 RepID=UPI000C2CAA09|nr:MULTISPECIES: ribonuclease domain-containing protein [unclassified Streptomyces]RKT08411.1 ribonuclease T1 [Streptomyces sp. 3211.6]RPF29809.1 ribonuclease T1 [Streptomyces sp. Ag109_G2-6]